MIDTKNNKQRIEYFDIAKILMMAVVIYGHSGASVGPLRFFESFFMPLFFIISGYFYSPKSLFIIIPKMAKTLLLPMYLSGVIGTSLAVVVGHIPNVAPFNDFFRHMIGMLIGPVGDFCGISIHVLWFFGALFWGRVFLDFLSRTFSEFQILSVSLILYVVAQRLMFWWGIQSWFYILHGISLHLGITCRKCQWLDLHLEMAYWI